MLISLETVVLGSLLSREQTSRTAIFSKKKKNGLRKLVSWEVAFWESIY